MTYDVGTITAFTAPLIYLQNKEFIDEQICQGGKLVNAQIANGRQLTEKYAGEAAARARATAGDLSQKVQVYTRGAPTEKNEFPTAPVHEPVSNDANGAKETEYRPEQPVLAQAY